MVKKRTRKRNKRSSRTGRSIIRKKSLGNYMTRWGLAKYSVHKYRRYGRDLQIPLTSNPGGADLTKLIFKLSNITGVGDFQSLYDNYRIDFIELKLFWSPTALVSLNPNNPGSSTFPLIYYHTDPDTITPPASIQVMKEFSNVRTRRLNPNRTLQIFIKPSILNEIRSSTGVTSFIPKWRQIIDMADPDVQHLGLSIGIQHIPNSAQGTLMIEPIYHITCFGTR